MAEKHKFKRFPDYDCDGGCPYESPESCTVCLNRKNEFSNKFSCFYSSYQVRIQ